MPRPAPATNTSTTTIITVTTRRAATPPRTTSSVCWATCPPWLATGAHHILLFYYFTHTVVKSYVMRNDNHVTLPTLLTTIYIPTKLIFLITLSTEARMPPQRWRYPWLCTATSRILMPHMPSLCRTTQVRVCTGCYI